MQHHEVSCAVRPIEWPLGVKWLISLSLSLRLRYCTKRSDSESDTGTLMWFGRLEREVGRNRKRFDDSYEKSRPERKGLKS